MLRVKYKPQAMTDVEGSPRIALANNNNDIALPFNFGG
jgi:hypothetical protein